MLPGPLAHDDSLAEPRAIWLLTAFLIVAIVLTLCGFGFLLTLIYGWMRSTEWNIKNIMMAYTLGWILWITGSVLNPGQYTYLQGQLQKG